MIRKSIGSWIPSQDMTETVQLGVSWRRANAVQPMPRRGARESELVTAKPSKGLPGTEVDASGPNSARRSSDRQQTVVC